MKQIKLSTFLLVGTLLITGLATMDSFPSEDVRARAKRVLQAKVGNYVIPSLKSNADVDKYCTKESIDYDEWDKSDEVVDKESAKTTDHYNAKRADIYALYKKGFGKASGQELAQLVGFPLIFPCLVLVLLLIIMFIWFLIWLCVKNCGDKTPVFFGCTTKCCGGPEKGKRVLTWIFIVTGICFAILFIFWAIWFGITISKIKYINCAMSASYAGLVLGLDTDDIYDFPGINGVTELLDTFKASLNQISDSTRMSIKAINPVPLAAVQTQLNQQYTRFIGTLSTDYSVINAVTQNGPKWIPDSLTDDFKVYRTDLKKEVTLFNDFLASIISVQGFLTIPSTMVLALEKLSGELALVSTDFKDFANFWKNVPVSKTLNTGVWVALCIFFVLFLCWLVYSLIFFQKAFFEKAWLKWRCCQYVLFAIFLVFAIVLNLFAVIEVAIAMLFSVVCHAIWSGLNDSNFMDTIAKPTDRFYKIVHSCMKPDASGTMDGLYSFAAIRPAQYNDLIQATTKFNQLKSNLTSGNTLAKTLLTSLTDRLTMTTSDSALAVSSGIDAAMATLNPLIQPDNDLLIYFNSTSQALCTSGGYTTSTAGEAATFGTGAGNKHCISLQTPSTSKYAGRYPGAGSISSAVNAPLTLLMDSVQNYKDQMGAFVTGNYDLFVQTQTDAVTEIKKSMTALESLSTAMSGLNDIIADYGGTFFSSLDCRVMSTEFRRVHYSMCVRTGPPLVVHTSITVWLGILMFLLSCVYCTEIRWVAYEVPLPAEAARKYQIDGGSEQESKVKSQVYEEKQIEEVKKGKDEEVKKGKDEEVRAVMADLDDDGMMRLVMKPMD
jgi:hypothetical protein